MPRLPAVILAQCSKGGLAYTPKMQQHQFITEPGTGSLLVLHQYHQGTVMRTTLDIDDGVLAAVKELAQREGRTVGAVVSEMARQVLTQGASAVVRGAREEPAVCGFRALPADNAIVTNALVDQLRDEQGIRASRTTRLFSRD